MMAGWMLRFHYHSLLHSSLLYHTPVEVASHPPCHPQPPDPLHQTVHYALTCGKLATVCAILWTRGTSLRPDEREEFLLIGNFCSPPLFWRPLLHRFPSIFASLCPFRLPQSLPCAHYSSSTTVSLSYNLNLSSNSSSFFLPAHF